MRKWSQAAFGRLASKGTVPFSPAFLPIAGGNPVLASARAIENQIYLVTSLRNNTRIDWIKTAIYGLDGKLLDFVEGRGVALAEVDLDAPACWAHIGDLKGQLTRQRPEVDRAAAGSRQGQTRRSPVQAGQPLARRLGAGDPAGVRPGDLEESAD